MASLQDMSLMKEADQQGQIASSILEDTPVEEEGGDITEYESSALLRRREGWEEKEPTNMPALPIGQFLQ